MHPARIAPSTWEQTVTPQDAGAPAKLLLQVSAQSRAGPEAASTSTRVVCRPWSRLETLSCADPEAAPTPSDREKLPLSGPSGLAKLRRRIG